MSFEVLGKVWNFQMLGIETIRRLTSVSLTNYTYFCHSVYNFMFGRHENV